MSSFTGKPIPRSLAKLSIYLGFNSSLRSLQTKIPSFSVSNSLCCSSSHSSSYSFVWNLFTRRVLCANEISAFSSDLHLRTSVRARSQISICVGHRLKKFTCSVKVVSRPMWIWSALNLVLRYFSRVYYKRRCTFCRVSSESWFSDVADVSWLSSLKIYFPLSFAGGWFSFSEGFLNFIY